MEKNIVKIIVLFVCPVIIISFIGNYIYNKSLDEKVDKEQTIEHAFGVDCLPCNCSITAKSVIVNPVDYSKYDVIRKIKLPENQDLEIIIGDDVWTKTELLEIKKATPIELPIK